MLSQSLNKNLKEREWSPALNFKKSIASEAREVYEKWKGGDLKAKMPIGVFSPRIPVLCNLNFI